LLTGHSHDWPYAYLAVFFSDVTLKQHFDLKLELVLMPYNLNLGWQ